MIFASDKFRKKFVNLGDTKKNNIISIITRYNSLPQSEKQAYLVSLCGPNGKALWSGISKTLFHLYPLGTGKVDRLFYCYATDLEDHVREKTQISEGLILIDYTTTKNEEYRSAKNYEKGNIKYYQVFDPPVQVVSNPIYHSNTPTFWFCLTSRQDEVLNAKQPLLVKGSAGAGKTLISFELFKHWIAYTEMEKVLYITYTDNLLNLAIRTLEDDGLVFIDDGRFKCLKFEDIYKTERNIKVINEKQARDIISNILLKLKKSNKLPNKILFSEYFVYSYIRGLIKGRFMITKKTKLDITKLERILYDIYKPSGLSLGEQSKMSRCFMEAMNETPMDQDAYHSRVKNKLLSSLHKKEKVKLSEKLDHLFYQNYNFDKLNSSLYEMETYDFILPKDIELELSKDGLTNAEIQLMIEISNKYNDELNKLKLYDDNDYAKFLLNSELQHKDKYDGIIVDEVQDLTEIQIEAIVKFTKDDSISISFFGDPNQTINPTVYDYGRFNSFVYNKTSTINREFLKETHRCGPNLLEYINHLTRLRKEFLITNEKEDLEKEISAVVKTDTYWACLIDNNELINYVLEMFINAVDCYMIVDNNNTRDSLIQRINKMSDFEYQERIDNQIITVQDAKGLESKNVIIYNLISDNLSIFNNIMYENNKVSSMTFNKLYVSCTRAQDSLLICEERLDEAEDIKNKLFYFNGKSMAENISEEDVSLYLSISFDPEVFYEQALQAIDDYNYVKAQKKNNIAMQNIVNQFDFSKQQQEEHPFVFIESYLRDSLKYNILLQSVDIRNLEQIEKYRALFTELVEEYVSLTNSSNEIEALNKRLALFSNVLETHELCRQRNDFDELVSIMEDKDKMAYMEKFILLNDYNCSEHSIGTLDNQQSKKAMLGITKYIFNLVSFEEVMIYIMDMANLTAQVLSKIINNTNIISDYFEQLEVEIIELEGIVYE